MKENIKFIGITKYGEEIEFCITNSTKIDSLIKIIKNFQFRENGYLQEIKILEKDRILKRKIKKQIKRR